MWRRLSTRWLLEPCKAKLIPAVERLQRDKGDEYLQGCIAALRAEITRVVPAICQQVACAEGGAARAGPGRSGAVRTDDSVRSSLCVRRVTLGVCRVWRACVRAQISEELRAGSRNKAAVLSPGRPGTSKTPMQQFQVSARAHGHALLLGAWCAAVRKRQDAPCTGARGLAPQVVLHLITSPYFRSTAVTPALVEELAGYVAAAANPAVAPPGMAEFKATLQNVVEAICQQTELVLQHHQPMIDHLLPALCAVVGTRTETGDMRFFALRMVSEVRQSDNLGSKRLVWAAVWHRARDRAPSVSVLRACCARAVRR